MLSLPRLLSFILFLALCASLTVWIMPLFSPAPRTLLAPATSTLSNTTPNLSSAATLLGGINNAPSDTQYQLTGIVRAQNTHDSVAILSVAGQTAISLKVGEKFADGIKLSEIHADYVVLNDHGNDKRIALVTVKSNQLAATAMP